MKITIITVCKNVENLIEQTIESVLEQTYQNIEYIIIDGKSIDQTLNIISKYEYKVSKIVSEQDDGIYDAMNKGIKVATGEIIYFLNSGDKLHNNKVIEDVVSFFEKDENLDLIYGDALLFKQDESSPIFLKKQKNIDNLFLVNDNVCHQTVFCKKYIFDKFGCFDLNFSICADFYWFLRLFRDNSVKKSHIDLVVVDYLLGGISSNQQKFEFQHRQILLNFFSKTQVHIYKVMSKFRPFSRYYIKIN